MHCQYVCVGNMKIEFALCLCFLVHVAFTASFKDEEILNIDGGNNSVVENEVKELKVTTQQAAEETCDQEENKCAFGADCVLRDGFHVCQCPEGLAGSKCQVIVDCGANGKYQKCMDAGGVCMYVAGKAVCECGIDKAFDIFTQTCRACDCGNPLNLGCEFVEGKKTCKCPLFQAQKENKCEDCFCGPQGSCRFVGETKKCDCGDGFAEVSGFCKKISVSTTRDSSTQKFMSSSLEKESMYSIGYTTRKIPDCDCGEKSFNCILTTNGDKQCVCHPGYFQNRGICEGVCKRSADCQHGGACRRDVGRGVRFCECRPPYVGDWCEKIDPRCDALDCDAVGADCKVARETVECVCASGKMFWPHSGRCEEYSELWIVSIVFFCASGLLLIIFIIYFCISRRSKQK